MTTTASAASSSEVVSKSIFIRPEGKQPNVNTKKKTEDVTNTKGLTFADLNLSAELQLVSNFYSENLL